MRKQKCEKSKPLPQLKRHERSADHSSPVWKAGFRGISGSFLCL
jgi:hypothetical protein